jgi:superfamily II DNA/RNA helicase
VAADHKDYLHRSGRTGRAGAEGLVITLVTEREAGKARKLMKKLDLGLPLVDQADHLVTARATPITVDRQGVDKAKRRSDKQGYDKRPKQQRQRSNKQGNKSRSSARRHSNGSGRHSNGPSPKNRSRR